MASSVTAPRPAAPARNPAPLVPAGLARLTGFALLGALGALEWQRMVSELSAWLALAWVAAGAVAGALVLAAGHLGPVARHVAATGVALLALPAAWLVAGLDLGLFRESRWPELGDGIARGLEALSQVKLPYEGADPWPARTLQALGALLCMLGGLLCVWPRDRTQDARALGFPLVALVALLVLVAVPVVALGVSQPVLLGLLLAGLTVLFLLLERVPLRPGLGVAALMALALVGAPALGAAADKEQPWFDYKAFAETLSPEDPVRFRWEHGDYGPINWERTGAEVLRIATEEPSYWKVQNLDMFDGVGWRSLPRRFGDAEPDVPRRFRDREEFVDRLDVRVRRLRGTRIVAAGTILNIRDSTRAVDPGPEDDSWVTRSEMRAGDSYSAEVYVPRPAVPELAAAPAVLPGTRTDDLRLRVPLIESWPGVPTSAPGAPPGYADVTFEGFDPFGARGRAEFPQAGDAVAAPAGEVMRRSPYARTWRLAQRLREGAESPYAYVLAVNRHLSGADFTYDERPAPSPRGQAPLEHFLFRSKAGYCQHYSAAMALLLRMGGVPARVATGFSPGGYSERRGAWIVRDTDAHSWVEVWFEGIGWVPFDPTPANTPARSQIAALENEDDGDDAAPFSGDSGANTSSGGDGDQRNVRGDSPEATDDAAGGAGSDDAGIPGWLAWPLVIVGVVALLLGGLWLRARRRGDAVDSERAIAELQRALRRTGRSVAAGTTLAQLEKRLSLTGDAAAYVRSLRAGRYAPRARPPSAAGRRALRRELSEGAGWIDRLRVLRSLPPRIFAP